MVAGRYGSVLTLRKRSEFLLVQNTGRRAKGRHVVVLALPNGQSGSRLGLTVSKRVGNAVVRNRVRRRLRELVRTGAVRLPSGADVVVIAYPSAASVGTLALQDDLRRCLGRLVKGESR